MSGGHFDYKQYSIQDIADDILKLIENNEENNYSPATIEKFKEAVETLCRAATMAQRVDWLVSCDDSEESFHKRWAEERV